jgi:formylglycine-generating enzyme required for sulfatase activity
LLGAIRRDLAPYGYRPADARYADLMRNVMAIFDADASQTVPVQTRVAAAESLGQAGDPRPGVGLRADRPGLPDILWCDVPGGTLMMGSAKDEEDADEDEYGPAGRPFPVDVEAYRLAAFPVTSAQFRPFVEGDGYQNRAYWTEAGWEWKLSEDATKPALWDDPRWNIANYPVVGVTWYEAVAWCRWLTQQLREVGELSGTREIRLPTEAEWEWAARGPDALKYPWGNDWRENACNHDAVGLDRTCAVGLFPAGACLWLADKTEPKCQDLSGNVWEWCSTKWRDSYKDAPDESLEGDAARVLRGGAYYNEQRHVRCAFRNRHDPRLRYGDRGFRCAQ